MFGLLLSGDVGGSDPVTTPGAMSAVMDAATELVSFAGNLFNTILQNPVLVFFVAAGFVGIGLSIVKRLKNTAKG